MKEAIRRRALELGFDACRFTSAEPPVSAAHLRAWLDAGRHGEMAWLERSAPKRMEPQRVLFRARSMICLLASYCMEAREARDERQAQETPHCEFRTRHLAVIARYAQFQDYHRILGQRLKSLARFINQTGGAGTRSLWYVDTGPVLERDFAQRAGLGFIGKHTNLISRQFGNWIFLAEVLTSLELAADTAESNRCGTCARCLAACPTRAIIAPFQLDARLCISYLTIELRGPIPAELRPAVGDRIFGCDDCLAACPWNRFARESGLMPRHARLNLASADLLALLQLDEAGFRTRFAGTPIQRIKLNGLRRNVCVALGNVGDASTLPALQRAADEFETLVAEHAHWACRQIESRLKQRS